MHIICWSVGIISAIVMVLMCAGLYIASLNAHSIDQRTRVWYAVGYLEKEHEWAETYDWNAEAEKLDPYNARHKRNRFILEDWRVYLQRFDRRSQRDAMLAALAAVEDWLRLSPYSAYAWASKADLLARLGMFKQAATTAFMNAYAIGAWDDLTRKKLMQTALTFWDETPDVVKETTRTLIKKAFLIDTTLQKQPVDRYIFDLAIANNWEGQLRDLIDDEKLRRRFENLIE